MSASSSPSSFFAPSSLDEESLPLPSSLSIDTGNMATLNNNCAEAASSANNNQSKTSSTTPSSNKRWTWTKPEGKPKRPLSSYNLFFRNCREKLVAGLPLEAALATGNATADEQLSQDLAHILSDLANARAHEARLVSSGLPPPKRAHKRQHGKVSFKDMAQVVGDAWKNLDTTTRTIYDAAAAVEKKRYVAEVQRWKEEQEKKKKQVDVASTSPSSSTSQAAKPEKKTDKRSSSSAAKNTAKKARGGLMPATSVRTSTTTVDAKAIAKNNSIRNAERRRMAAIKTIADQAQEQHQNIKKKDPFNNGTSMPSALSMMSLASPQSTSPELSHIPSSMASYFPMSTSAGTSQPPICAIGSTTSDLGGLMHQFQQQKAQIPQHRATFQQPSYTPAQLPSTMAMTNIATTQNASSTWDADAFTSATRRLLEKTETFRRPASTSATKPQSFAASSTMNMDIEPEPLPEATIEIDEARLTPPPQPREDQSQFESVNQSAPGPKSLRRSSSLLSLSDVPLDFSEEDFNDLSKIFEEGAACPNTATSAAAAFGAKPEAQQASFQQTTSLVHGPWEGHGQRSKQDDMSTMLNHWGGARSA